MNIWNLTNWMAYYGQDGGYRTGLRMRFEKGVDPYLRENLLMFAQFIRLHYKFPQRVPVYVKSSACIKALDGDLVSATFFGPTDRDLEPYIRLATGDFHELEKEHGLEDAVLMTCNSLAHELTHYYQWLNRLEMPEEEEEAQAENNSAIIINQYIDYFGQMAKD